MPLWNVSEPGPGAGGWDGEKAVVDTPASQGRYTRYSGTHMVSDISGFYNRGFCTSLPIIKSESVKKYIYCIDRMYDIYNKILRLIFTVYSG